ncbi:MFS transporter [Nocardia asiatica]|uniref:MFS transporter n=1 Tax=Nocardia asiatica TaxID=209252 RepID=UPI0024542A00|nr:MFS transporter [Nocardia asiatica]
MADSVTGTSVNCPPVWGSEQMRSRGVLAERGFRALWVANAFGDIASNLTVVALSVTSVVVLHASPFQVGVIAALSRAAYLVVALPVGVWVDRWSRKRVLIVSDLVRLAAVLWIPLGYFLDVLAIWQLMLVGAVVSTANVFFDVAHTAILPSLVGRKRVSEASARLQSVDTMTSATIPAVAGKLIASISVAATFLVAGVFSLVSALFVWRIPDGRAENTRASEPVGFRTAVREGIRYVAGHRILRATVTAGVLLNFGAGMYNAVIAVYVLRDCGLSASQYGYALALGSAGGFVGSLVGRHIGRALGEVRTQVVGYFTMGAALAAPTVGPHLPIPIWISYAAAVFLLSFLLVVISVNTSGMNARLTPHRLLGRVSASRRFATLGIVPIGALVGGVASSHLSAATTLLIAAAFPASTLVVFAFSPVIGMRVLPAELEVDDDTETVVPQAAATVTTPTGKAAEPLA